MEDYIECPYCLAKIKKDGGKCILCLKEIDNIDRLKKQISDLEVEVSTLKTIKVNRPAFDALSRTFSWTTLLYLIALCISQTIASRRDFDHYVFHFGLLSLFFIGITLVFELQKNIWIISLYLLIVPISNFLLIYFGERSQILGDLSMTVKQIHFQIIGIICTLTVLLAINWTNKSEVFSITAVFKYFEFILDLIVRIIKFIPFIMAILLLLKFLVNLK